MAEYCTHLKHYHPTQKYLSISLHRMIRTCSERIGEDPILKVFKRLVEKTLKDGFYHFEFYLLPNSCIKN